MSTPQGLGVAAYKRLNSQIIEFRESFSLFDDENVSFADRDAFWRGMRALGMQVSNEEVDALMEKFDS